jgi:beta-galactosidase
MTKNGKNGGAPGVFFGAAYYPEYESADRIPIDLKLMREAGFTLIRVGESTWSNWEPRDNQFELDWLQPVLDGAYANGISVVLGTPTYAVPPWLMKKHPEIAAEVKTGIRMPWGSRQEIDTSNPTFRSYAERIIRAVVGRYAGHPAVVGFQVDNEPGNVLLYNAGVFAGFKSWLLGRYADIGAINEEWNLAHWAHRMTDIEELWTPDGNHVPQYDLAWRQYQAELTTEYIGWQVELVNQYANAAQFVFTCIDVMRPAADGRAIALAGDVAAANQYHATQDQLGPQAAGDPTFPPSGSWAPFYAGDRSWAMRQARFIITETNATSVGFPWYNYPAFDGQWRQVAWAMIARGAKAIEYWNWHTMHASWESQWAGVLPHSFQPGRVYDQVAALGREITAAGIAVDALRPDASVGLLFSGSTRWAFEFQPPLQQQSDAPYKQGEPDRAAYDRIVYRFYGGLSRAGHQVRVLHVEDVADLTPGELVAALPAIVAPAIYLLSDALATRLVDYAAAGGHLVLGVRTGYANERGRIAPDRQPARLSTAAGVYYDEFSNLAAPVTVSGELTGSAEGLIEGLIPVGAETIASYDHPHFGRWAAATTTPYGQGRVTYVGAVPDLELATSLGRWLAVDNPWRAQLIPGTVTAHSARNAANERIWFLHNFGFDPHSLTTPSPMIDVLTGERVDTIALGKWDVRILKEVSV